MKVLLTGATEQDRDGFTLVDAAVYRLRFLTDTATGRPPPVTVSDLTYTSAIHEAFATADPPIRANAGKPSELAKVGVISRSPPAANALDLARVRARFMDSGLTPLTTSQLRALLSKIEVVRGANQDPGTGLYYPALDTEILVSLASGSFVLDGTGLLTLPISTGTSTKIVAASSAAFFLVGHWTADAPAQSPSSIRVRIVPDSDLRVLDAPSLVEVALASTDTLTTAAQQVITAQPAPGGTTWPRDLGGPGSAVDNLPGTGWAFPADVYVGSRDGRLVALNSDGTLKWGLGTGSPVRSSPLTDIDPSTGKDLVYFANDAGSVVKARNDGTVGTQLWSRSVGGPLESSPVQNDALDAVFIGSPFGRVEKLSWALFAGQAKGLLDHLGIEEAFVLGGCMGCSVALAFAARFPESTRALILHWPVGGYRWKLNGQDRFGRHLRFARENGLPGVVKRAHEGKSFWQDPEAGPWASAIVRDRGFAASFETQDLDRYLGLVAASARVLFDRDTVPGAEPEEIMGMKVPALIVPGDDPSHATSGAHYLREVLPQPEFWPVMPPEQATNLVCDRVLEFGRAHR